MPFTAANPAHEKKAQLIWTGFILAFFVIQAILWSVAITFTANDPSHRVVAGYDEQALSWDDQRTQQAASDRLGWELELTVDPAGDIYRNRGVLLRVRDADGRPVEGLSVAIKAFHRGRAAEEEVLQFQSVEPGLYATRLPVHYPGQWRFTGTLTRGNEMRLVEENLRIAQQQEL